MTVWLSGMRITADRLNNYDVDDSTTTGLTAASGFSVNDFYAYRSKGTVILDMYLERTGADITASGGNIGDTQICTVPSGWRPNLTSTINGSWDDGTASGGFVIGTDGVTTLRTASGNIVTGRNLRLHISFNVEP